MARCPNCDRETARTTDWACQWCGHPLLAGHYKKIDKTFRELKEERESQQPVIEEVRPEPPPKPRPQPAVKPMPPPVARAAQVAKQTPFAEPASVVERAPEPVRKAEPPPAPEPPVIQQTPPNVEMTGKPVAPAQAPASAPATPPEPVAQTQTAPELKNEPAPAVVEITVADMLSAYETRGPSRRRQIRRQDSQGNRNSRQDKYKGCSQHLPAYPEWPQEKPAVTGSTLRFRQTVRTGAQPAGSQDKQWWCRVNTTAR